MGPLLWQKGHSCSSAAYALCEWSQTHNRPVWLICPEDSIETFSQAIETFLVQRGLAKCDTIEETLFVLPDWPHSPYVSVSPSLKVRFKRIALFNRLARSTQDPSALPRIIVSSAASALQWSLSELLQKQNSHLLRVGGSIPSRPDWIRSLLEAGYQAADPVVDPGTFAQRGEILDLFAPDQPYPVRIELFDTEIERLRYYDSETQRTDPNLPSLDSLWVGPAREVLINPRTYGRLRERLKEYADLHTVPRRARDPILEQMKNGHYPDHCEFWAAWTSSEGSVPRTLLDHWRATGGLVATFDPWRTREAWQKNLAELLPQHQKSLVQHRLIPAPEDIYAPLPDLTKFSALVFERFSEHLSVDSKSGPVDVSVGPILHTSFFSDLKTWIDQGIRVELFAATESHRDRLRFLLEQRNIRLRKGVLSIEEGCLDSGFVWPEGKIACVAEHEVTGKSAHRKAPRDRVQRKKTKASDAADWQGFSELSHLSAGDLVVHVDHGIGRYIGLNHLAYGGTDSDFLVLEFAGNDRLYLPAYRLNTIHPYVGSGGAEGEGTVTSIALDRLGSQNFAKAKERVRETVQKLAFDLVELYAKRQIVTGMRFERHADEYAEFESRFLYDETPDQLRAIDATLDDLCGGKIMDRLVCGDVGYGKTEVAMRAAYLAALNGRQVAVLVPTTVLARQHEITFRNRFADLPVRIESLSRFKNTSEQKKILADTAAGKIDILIGTHRLLSKDMQFAHLALVIVDEEHRFGVEHKEKLKNLKTNLHVLTLTATPIPRTLHMALGGIRDISVINTPPVDRLPIQTSVARASDDLIQRAIRLELDRGGQVFFVHNRVQELAKLSKLIEEMVPDAQIALAHGQMAETTLEKSMVAFTEQKANILLCTAIVESGIDLPNANTVIIYRADILGLSQLYQIRGRVGRGQQRGHAYLLVPPTGGLSETATRRLEVIQKFVELGSGFHIASHDLEIRGGGDLLGPQQSGHIADVGFEMYLDLLNEAVLRLSNNPNSVTSEASRGPDPEIKVPYPAYLPEDYVEDVQQRLSLYRKIASSPHEAALDEYEQELQERYGRLPEPAQNLLWVIRLKLILRDAGVEMLTASPEKVSLTPGNSPKVSPARAIALCAGAPQTYQLLPDSRLIATITHRSISDLTFKTRELLELLR